MDADGTGRENSLLLGIELILRQIVSFVKGFSRISDGKIAEKGPGRLCCKSGTPAPSPGQGESPLPGKTEKGKGAAWGVLPLSVLLECGWGGNSRLSQRGLCLCPVQSVAVKDIAQHVFRAPLQLGQSQAALLIAFQGGGGPGCPSDRCRRASARPPGRGCGRRCPRRLKVRVGALAHPPVGHHAALIAPLAPQNRGAKVIVIVAPNPVDLVVAGHDVLGPALLYADLKAFEIDLPQGPLGQAGIVKGRLVSWLLQAKCLGQAGDAVFLNAPHHGGGNFPGDQGVLGEILKVPAAQGGCGECSFQAPAARRSPFGPFRGRGD